MHTILVGFREIRHCSHVKENEWKYWSVVRELWEMRDVDNGAVI